MKKITAVEFATQNGFSDRDIFSVSVTYRNTYMTEEEWNEELSGKYSFTFTKKAEEIKNKKQK